MMDVAVVSKVTAKVVPATAGALNILSSSLSSSDSS